MGGLGIFSGAELIKIASSLLTTWGGLGEWEKVELVCLCSEGRGVLLEKIDVSVTVCQCACVSA